jgi:RHS repeat-associated protein
MTGCSGFTGKERDAETGLDYFGARYYGGPQGRFTSPDPFNPILRIGKRSQFNAFLSQPQNWNAYAYTWNNPLRFTDPTGENVYLVMYTQGNSVGDEELKRAAQTKAAEIQRSRGFDPKKDQVMLKGVTTKDDFKSALAAANKAGLSSGGVQQVNMFSHAGALNGPVFHGGTVGPTNSHGSTQFGSSELNSLPGLTWSQGASATFYGCRTTNFAGQFASTEGVSSFGTTGPSYFSSRPDRLSSFGGTGSLYLIDTIFNKNIAPNIINFTKQMEEHNPE